MASANEYLQSVLAGTASAPSTEREDPTIDGVYVIDADTIVNEERQKIRFAGVDAPETGKVDAVRGKYQPEQPGAQLAIDYLKDILREGGVETNIIGEDVYGRKVAEVTDPQGRDVGERMIERGFARPTMFSEQGQRTAEVTANVRLSGIFDDAFSDEELIKNRQLEYEKEIAGFDPNYSGLRSTPSYARGTFTKAVSRGVDNTQGLLYAASNAIGEFTGIDTIAEWGQEGMLRNMAQAALSPAEIGKFDDVESLANFGTYVLEAIGEQLPNIALTATGAGAGAVAARAAIGKALLTKAMARAGAGVPLGGTGELVAQGLAKSALVKAVPTLGAAATTYPLGVGEVQQELREAGIDEPGTALLAGLPIAALDALSFNLMFGKLFKGVNRELAEDLVGGTASALGFAKDLVKGGLLGGLAEIPTETAQELIVITSRAYHDPSYEIFSDENLARLRETAIKAGIVGTASGGFASGVQSIREMPLPESFTPNVPPVEPTVEPTEPVIEVASIESVDPDHTTRVEIDDGSIVEMNTREIIKRQYDEPISNLEKLTLCMRG